MSLTEQDKKMIAHLKGQHQAWSQIRWIILVSALFFAVLYFSGFIDDAETVLVIGSISGLLSYSLGGWSGRPEISLLLKLAEDRYGNDVRVDS